jgi:hypothetical protein
MADPVQLTYHAPSGQFCEDTPSDQRVLVVNWKVRRALRSSLAPGGPNPREKELLLDDSDVARLVVGSVLQCTSQEADVRYVGRVLATPPVSRRGRFQRRIRPIMPGYSIGHEDITAGTIGAFVTRGRYECVLSNNHVLANTNRSQRENPLLQPGPADGGRARDEVGWLSRYEPLRRSGNLIDAAIGHLSEDIEGWCHPPLRLLRGRPLRRTGPHPEPDAASPWLPWRLCAAPVRFRTQEPSPS